VEPFPFPGTILPYFRFQRYPVGGNAGLFHHGKDRQMTEKSQSAGGRHGSKAKSTAERTDRDPASNSGLNERTGEFRVGEDVIFGMRNGNVLIRRSPQGEEVEVSETTLAGLIVDAFFIDKFDGEYATITGAPK
jgi:hypothetical protein